MGRETVTIASGMDADSGTVCYDGTETYSNGLAAGDTYYDLAFTGVGGTWVFIDPLLINGDLFVGGWFRFGRLFCHGEGRRCHRRRYDQPERRDL